MGISSFVFSLIILATIDMYVLSSLLLVQKRSETVQSTIVVFFCLLCYEAVTQRPDLSVSSET